MTRPELSAQSANILRAVSSKATCTTATVESLKSALLPSQLLKVQPKESCGTVPGAKAARPRKAVASSSKKSVVKVLEILESGNEEFKPQEKLVLATEVFNTTLKALTDAAKIVTTQQASRPRKASLARSSSNSSGLHDTASRCVTPLRQISSNCIVDPPTKDALLRRSSSSIAKGREAGLRAQAECARVAMAARRNLLDQRPTKAGDASLSLEMGMSALIAKLLALGYEDLALKELRILKRRIEKIGAAIFPDDCKQPLEKSRKIPQDEVLDARLETLPEMLKIKATKATGPLLSIVVTTQLQVLRLLKSKADISSTQAALENLSLGVPHSPVNMIRRQIDPTSVKTQERAANQLESFSQCLLSISSDLSSGKGGIHEPKHAIRPQVAFDLQMLALQVRKKWWSLVKHRSEVLKELVEPFARYLVVFRRRCSLENQGRYQKAVTAFNAIILDLDIPAGNHSQGFSSIYHNIAELAQECAQCKDAIDWMEKAVSSLDRDDSLQAKRCALICRKVTFLIRSNPSYNNESTHLLHLERIVTSLEGGLHGTSDDLDELLIAVGSLRKSAFVIIQDSQKTTQNENLQPSSNLLRACVRFSVLALRFLNRYIGARPDGDIKQRTLLRYNERRRLASPFAKPFIESIVTITKVFAKSDMVDWTLIDSGLRDCVSLALTMEDMSLDKASPSILTSSLQSAFVSVSNGYWYRFLQTRQNLGDTKAAKSSLCISIDLIKGRGLSDQIAGALQTKLENYAQFCERLRDNGTALATYQGALQVQINSGLVQKAAKSTTTRSLPVVLDGENELRGLARNLAGYIRVAQKVHYSKDGPVLYYDDQSLPGNERGILLEYQLQCIVLIYQGRGASSLLHTTTRALTNTLLSIYSAKESPVRRLRTVVQMLYLRALSPAAIQETTFFALLDEYGHQRSQTAFSSEEGLMAFVPQLVTSLENFLAMREDGSNSRVFEKNFRSWTELLEQCSDWPDLQARVYDVQDWLLHLEMIVEYLAMQGLDLLNTSALHIMITIHEISTTTDCSDLVSKLCSLGVHYIRLGYCGAGGVLLQKANRYLESYQPNSRLMLKWHISYAEYALSSQNYNICNENLAKAQLLVEQDAKTDAKDLSKPKGQVDFDRLAADLQYVQSRLAANEGQWYKALLFARLCAKSRFRTWTTLERRQDRCNPEPSRLLNQSVNETLMTSMSELSLSENQSATSVSSSTSTIFADSQSANFWHLVPHLFESLLYLSQCFAHHGIYLESLYYLEQSRKIAETVRSSTMANRVLTIRGQYVSWYGDDKESLALYQQAEEGLDNNAHSTQLVLLKMKMAAQSKRCDQQEAGDAFFSFAKRTLDNLMQKPFLDGLIYKPTVAADLEAVMGDPSLQKTSSTQQRPTKARSNNSKQPSKSKTQAKRAQTCCNELLRVDVIPLDRMQGNLLREQSISAMNNGSIDLAQILLDEASARPCTQETAVLQALATGRLYLHQGLRELVRHPIFSVVPESTISCPSHSQRGNGQEQYNSADISQEKPRTTTKNLSGKKPLAKIKKEKVPPSDDSNSYLLSSQSVLSDILRLAQRVSSTVAMHDIVNLLSKVIMMICPLSLSSKLPAFALFGVYIAELGRTLPWMRESVAIGVERHISDSNEARTALPGGPAGDLRVPEKGQESNDIAFATFQASYIDIIPKNWVVISMSMSETSEDLVISKIRTGKTPFILKIPLNRQDPMDSDEETFNFCQGKADLKDIIDLTNQSTQDAGDLSRKGAKTMWWDTRNALDARLKDLLNNIETIWLGGFRGIFSQTQPNAEILARFQQSLQDTLDKYLPSRQKTAKVNGTSRILLDSNVLDLFVGLGAPGENSEIDELLMDLLYFVVDILQFNGERNAYDEIDFDSIAIETLDALRQYHQAFNDLAQTGPKLHTILILDKSLHCFPWESLSCLKGCSVSRLPSLSCLKDRISQRNGRTSPKPSPTNDLFVNRHDGLFIMNPGGDLTNTQARFEEHLQNLVGWDSVVQREPTELQMKEGLMNHDIFLYFGHGSGGQYIRRKTIKKLDKCAVALLMGCSSGAITEAGAFESYGTPMDYIHAGCPAVLATLWDVTDKDVDRFSQTVLEEWGLFRKGQQPSGSSPIKKPTKRKGKGKMPEFVNVERVENHAQEPMSLDDAVAKGRDSCILRYLNGAAPVVYGIPVYLT